MARQRSLMLMIGVASAAVGCVLIVNPFEHEPLWAQWLLGFALFYVGLSLAIVGSAIYFVGNTGSPKDPFSPAQHSREGRKVRPSA